MTLKLSHVAGLVGLLASVALADAAVAGGTGLAFSPISLDIPALKGMSQGVAAVGGKQGYDVIILDPKFDGPTQAQQLNQLISSGRIKSAWAISVNPGVMGGVIDTAKEKGAVLVLNGEPKDYGQSGMVPGVTFARID